MGGLAHGGHAPVLIPLMMGGSALIIGATIDSLYGFIPLFGIFCLMLSAFCANFWRDPDRPIPRDENVLVSPADGHVMFVRRERATGRRPNKEQLASGECESDTLTGYWYPEPLEHPLQFETEQRFEPVKEGEESNDDVFRIAIFMSPLDVHVNRAPLAGTLHRMEHRAGKGLRRGPFLAAYKKESQYNERVRSVFKGEEELMIEVTQISGAFARTIVPWLGVDSEVRRGQRYGMIRLGSRVDIRAPARLFTPNVVSAEEQNSSHPKGEFVRAGSTILFIPSDS
ncbi:MAG: phosphatidylserine decarboxylase [Candidatus Poseidoniaceae archaeon]|nr:phosphatidylserine decarboxylase [Candidatus Poseidoniaceae archaeon]